MLQILLPGKPRSIGRTSRLTYRRRGGRWGANTIFKFLQLSERKTWRRLGAGAKLGLCEFISGLGATI